MTFVQLRSLDGARPEANVAWWQRLSFFGKREPVPRSPLLRGVLMNIPDWHEDPPSAAMRTWHHPHGGVLSLAVTSRDKLPPLSHLDLVRNAFRRVAEAGGAGLVEAEVVQSPHGASARMIYKKRHDRTFAFTGMLLLPVDAQWLVCTVVHAEQGTTGVREAVVTARLLETGDLTMESYEESWAQDPYDPSYRGIDRELLRYLSDDERFDAQFPEHPLSKARGTLNALIENVLIQ